MTAVLTGAGAQIYDEVGGPHHRLVVLYDNHGVAHVSQAGEGVDETVVVMGMQPDGGFVTYVENAGKTGPNLGCQSDPLGLTAGQCPRSAVHGHVVQSDTVQELQPALDFLEYLVGDGLVPPRQHFSFVFALGIRVDGSHPLHALGDVHGGHFHYAQVTYLHAQGLRLEALALAGLAGAGRHVTLNLLAGVVGVSLPVASLQVRDDALEPGLPAVGAAVVGAVPDGDLLSFDAVQDYFQVLFVHVPDRYLR